ncbi:MAG TPA: hypothetical protein VGW10_14895 [Solirubrobacteraceae bacterium]|nr:hypothetical protein [Solirubrobacteraceae bacterium]
MTTDGQSVSTTAPMGLVPGAGGYHSETDRYAMADPTDGNGIAFAEPEGNVEPVVHAVSDVIPLPTVAITSLLAWHVAAGLAVGAAAVHPRLALVPAIVAAVAVPSALRIRGLPGAAVGAALLTAAAVPFLPAAAWVAAAVLGALALSVRPERSDDTSIEDLQRHLSWCRRRGAEADVLVAQVAGDAVDADMVRECFRLTDSVHVERSGTGYEVLAVLDTHDLSRSGVAARVRAVLDPAAQLRWARFPADGVTLEDLVLRGRQGTSTAHAEPEPEPAALHSVEAVR